MLFLKIVILGILAAGGLFCWAVCAGSDNPYEDFDNEFIEAIKADLWDNDHDNEED